MAAPAAQGETVKGLHARALLRCHGDTLSPAWIAHMANRLRVLTRALPQLNLAAVNERCW